MGEMRIVAAAGVDAGEIFTLQMAAYVKQAQIFDNPHMPALVETLEQVADALSTKLCFKAVDDDRIIGSLRLYVDDGCGHISRVAVAPDQQRKGIATALMSHAEQHAPEEVKRFELFTGSLSLGNLQFYKNLGYEEFRREPNLVYGPGEVDTVYLEKFRH